MAVLRLLSSDEAHMSLSWPVLRTTREGPLTIFFYHDSKKNGLHLSGPICRVSDLIYGGGEQTVCIQID